MRRFAACVCGVVLLSGCIHRQPPRPVPPPQIHVGNKPVLTPDLRPVGRVETVNNQARFVVLSFGVGDMPVPGQILNIKHEGLKVGEVRITGPQHETDTVADIILGEANPGDEAQAQ